MLRHLAQVLTFAAILAFNAMPLFAQEPPPTAEELTLRPGDTITWTVNSPHRVRFGGTVMHNGPLALTPFADVQNILDFDPALTAGADGVALGPTGTSVKVTGTVKSSAAADAEFFFTCGFGPHNGSMVTMPFKLAAAIAGQPPRQIEIVPAMAPVRWLLKAATGDKNMNRP